MELEEKMLAYKKTHFSSPLSLTAMSNADFTAFFFWNKFVPSNSGIRSLGIEYRCFSFVIFKCSHSFILQSNWREKSHLVGPFPVKY